MDKHVDLSPGRSWHAQSRPAALIFDLDGTLADTLADLADAMNRALEFCAYPGADIHIYRQRIGWGLRELVHRSLPEEVANDEEEVNKVIAAFQAIYFTEPVRKTTVYPGISELISHLANSDIPLFVHTNKPDRVAGVIVNQLFGAGKHCPFLKVLGQREGIPCKPSPHGVNMLLDGIHISPSECWYIGDSEVDIATAHASGCRAIGVSWGFRSIDTLQEAQADYICHSADELGRVIG